MRILVLMASMLMCAGQAGAGRGKARTVHCDQVLTHNFADLAVREGN